jgi:hypothetical protein
VVVTVPELALGVVVETVAEQALGVPLCQRSCRPRLPKQLIEASGLRAGGGVGYKQRPTHTGPVGRMDTSVHRVEVRHTAGNASRTTARPYRQRLRPPKAFCCFRVLSRIAGSPERGAASRRQLERNGVTRRACNDLLNEV